MAWLTILIPILDTTIDLILKILLIILLYKIITQKL